MSKDRCQRELRRQGKAYPRTCQECGLAGPCKYEVPPPVKEQTVRRVILPAEAHTEIANAPKAFYAEKIAVGLIEQKIDPLQKYILAEDAFPWVRRVAEAAASPNAGKVTEAELEAATAAAYENRTGNGFNSAPKHIREEWLSDQRAALASLGLTVEG